MSHAAALAPATLCQSRAIAKLPSRLVGSQSLPVAMALSWCLLCSVFRLIRLESTPGQVKSAPVQVKSASGQVKSAPDQVESASGQVESVPDQVESAPIQVESASGQVEFVPDQSESASGQSESAFARDAARRMPCGNSGFGKKIC
jgi:hypothetical protein